MGQWVDTAVTYTFQMKSDRGLCHHCLLYTSPSPRDEEESTENLYVFYGQSMLILMCLRVVTFASIA